MGLIATSGRPEALDVFRKVMLASTSVPVAFPPVLFEVDADGMRYDEMHVDGAVGANVFYNGGVFSSAAVRERAGRGGGREEVFVIHNGQLGANPQATRRSVTSIALRTFDSAGKAATVGDLFRIYTIAARERAGFRWINIPDGVEIQGEQLFDPPRMKELYEVGRRRALEGPRWFTGPPGIWEDSRP
jgi:predicted acylesterase/phospholipase RssA